MEHPLNNHQAPYAPPLINFGVMPVQTNTQLSLTPSFAAVFGIFQIELELDVEVHHEFVSTPKPRRYAKDTVLSQSNDFHRLNTGRTARCYGGME